MTVKENLVELIREQGYDFFSACELAEEAIYIAETSDKPEVTIYLGKLQFTLKKGKKV